jgi:2-amino-4-hydroxy-6-hydroxymethyldihydropteridine diphosphokinase
MPETIYLLTGSNLGDREKKLNSAMTHLSEVEGLEIVATSGIYLSEAVDLESDSPPFMNQVVKADYQFTPNELLSALELIEQKMGRTGKGKKESRTIDLDILLFGQEIIELEHLSIPHRELLNRPFAMVPLLQIDPDLIHPVTGTPVAEFLSDEERESVELFRDHVARNV